MDFKTQVLAETDNMHYQVWKADEPDGETTYHLELNNVTVHFFTEEWEEFLLLIKHLGYVRDHRLARLGEVSGNVLPVEL
jgi:hypothetical protein